MNTQIVCVGGGGQHVALAIARMVRLGVWTNVPRILVIDADLGSPLARRLALFADINQDQKTTAGEVAVAHPVPKLQREPPLAVGTVGNSFRSAFLGSQANGADNAGGLIETELYELFYDTESDKVEIKEGMAAKPSVGSAIFADLGIRHLRDKLDGVFNDVQRIGVTSSFIGGTGAGVTHQLVKYLAENERRGNVTLHGSFLLQWINIPDGGAGAARNVTLENSATHGIQYFLRETAPRLKNAMLVGANAQTSRPNANDAQDETVSVYPLLAAYGLSYMLTDTAGARGGDGSGDNIHTLTTNGDRWEWLLTLPWNTGGAAAPTIAERWAAARVVDDFAQVFLDPETGIEFRELSSPAFKATGILGVGERLNWGSAIRRAAEKRKKDIELAAGVLRCLKARMEQLRMTTRYLDEVFGMSAEKTLAEAGAEPLRQRYAKRRKMTKLEAKQLAYRDLDNAFQHCSKEAMDLREGEPAEARIARLMEESLMKEVLSGAVLQ